MILASSDHQQPSPTSKLTINDLPEAVLVDILCRLPDYRVVHQCKLVSKRWHTLLSDPYFLTRFLCIQYGQQKPLLNRYVMIPTVDEDRKTIVLNISSEANSLPRLEAQSISSILPAIPKVHVEGTYNDLVLCTGGTCRRVYYICNYYTKEWIRLPPAAPRCSYRDKITTGFICNLPYYSFKEEAGASCNSSNKVLKLHAEYRFKVVRLFTTLFSERFSVEIFSSETGKWREYSFPSTLYDQRTAFKSSNGIACNGKLYWLTYQGSVFELDPFNMCTTASASTNHHVITSCRFIELPAAPNQWHIGVCRGRLYICRRFFHGHYDEPVVIWELKEIEVMSSKPEWCLLHRMSLSEMICKQPFSITNFIIVGFHPTDKDIVYLLHIDGYASEPRYVVMCNVREKSLEIALKIPSENTSAAVSWINGQIFTSVIPWWPTPVPTGLNFLEEDLDITVDIFTLKVGSLSTVKQLKQELEKKRGRQLFDHELLHFDGRALDDDDYLVTDYGIKDSSNITLSEKPYVVGADSSNHRFRRFSRNR